MVWVRIFSRANLRISVGVGARVSLVYPRRSLRLRASSQPKELPPSAFKLISVKTTGTKRYKSEEIIAATGLQIGQTVSEDDFKKAARALE